MRSWFNPNVQTEENREEANKTTNVIFGSILFPLFLRGFLGFVESQTL